MRNSRTQTISSNGKKVSMFLYKKLVHMIKRTIKEWRRGRAINRLRKMKLRHNCFRGQLKDGPAVYGISIRANEYQWITLWNPYTRQWSGTYRGFMEALSQESWTQKIVPMPYVLRQQRNLPGSPVVQRCSDLELLTNTGQEPRKAMLDIAGKLVVFLQKVQFGNTVEKIAVGSLFVGPATMVSAPVVGGTPATVLVWAGAIAIAIGLIGILCVDAINKKYGSRCFSSVGTHMAPVKVKNV